MQALTGIHGNTISSPWRRQFKWVTWLVTWPIPAWGLVVVGVEVEGSNVTSIYILQKKIKCSEYLVFLDGNKLCSYSPIDSHSIFTITKNHNKIFYVNNHIFLTSIHTSPMIDHVMHKYAYMHMMIGIIWYSSNVVYEGFYGNNVPIFSEVWNKSFSRDPLFLLHFWLYLCILLVFQRYKNISILGLKWRTCPFLNSNIVQVLFAIIFKRPLSHVVFQTLDLGSRAALRGFWLSGHWVVSRWSRSVDRLRASLTSMEQSTTGIYIFLDFLQHNPRNWPILANCLPSLQPGKCHHATQVLLFWETQNDLGCPGIKSVIEL